MENSRIQDLRKKLDDVKAHYTQQRDEIETEIDHAIAKDDRMFLAEDIRDRITEAGHDVDDIANLLLWLTAPDSLEYVAKKERQCPKQCDRTKTDPVTSWMKNQMAALGMDAGSKLDRDRFRNEHMMKVE